ncbi:YbjN domain-containing protein [Aurantiacibacter hainanensis]|uniref:YbjN domain-containing protein n=1 Tax=Aurantiacibacter hainanensis TaxID=3076114 RepID=UPI0030C7002A
MNPERDTIEETQDAAPVDMLAALFEAHGWATEQIGDDEVRCEAPGAWTTYQVRGIWRQEDKVLQILCLPEIRVPEAKKRGAHELLARINEQLWLGHFEIWSQGGVILYRHALMLGDDGLLGLDMAQFAIESAISECDRFYPAFQFVLWGDKNPAEALDAALVDAAGEA